VCGTPGYIPPEAILGMGYSKKSDIFSAGSLFFSILTLKNLFFGKDYQTLMNLNKKCDLSDLEFQMKGCSMEAKNLCR
jgi:serine/threonine protein kinase